jgi:hypothetical protein
MLADKLTIFKQPTDALLTSWFQEEVKELRFTQPQQGTYGQDNFATGQMGDIVVIQKQNCDNVHTVSYSSYVVAGATHSRKMALKEAGGVTQGDDRGGYANDVALAEGAVNELGTGTYKICYATKSSGGESANDFVMLSKTIEILPTDKATPSLSVQQSVIRGQDMIVSWNSNIGLKAQAAVPNSWLGLYKKGDCDEEGSDVRHQCYKAFQFITASVSSGTVIFSQKDYQVSGEYEVRYFDGDSRNGQGQVCNGMGNVGHGAWVRCTLQAAARSSTIAVLTNDIGDTDNLRDRPGLEAVFGTSGSTHGRFTHAKYGQPVKKPAYQQIGQ